MSAGDIKLKQLHASGATGNELIRFNAATGLWTVSSALVDASGNLLPAGAAQNIGATASRWKRLFASHSVGGVDVFAGANTLDDARYVIAQDGTYTLTLPTAVLGWGYVIERQGSAGVVTLAAGASDTINGVATYVMLPNSVNYIFAQNVTDWRLFHLMTVADKTKLDALQPSGSVEHATIFSGTTVGTMSPTFLDAFAGVKVNPLTNGAWRAIFSGEYTASNGNTAVEIAIGVNSTTAAQTNSERVVTPASANKTSTFFTSIPISGLVVADDIHGIFRRPLGSGSALLKRRRLTIEKVTV